jgi:DNA-binding MarR family transcriptional regulator
MVNYSSTLDDTYFALSNNLRRELLLHVQAGPQRLVDLAKRLKISLPALHKHIDILERARLIHKKKVGRERYVSANLMTLQSAEDWIAEYTKYWNNQFDSIEAYIEILKETK